MPPTLLFPPNAGLPVCVPSSFLYGFLCVHVLWWQGLGLGIRESWFQIPVLLCVWPWESHLPSLSQSPHL